MQDLKVATSLTTEIGYIEHLMMLQTALLLGLAILYKQTDA